MRYVSVIENAVHNIVIGRPFLKSILRNNYQRLRSIFFRRTIVECAVIQKFDHCFGGFHDVEIFNKSENKVVLHRSKVEGRPNLKSCQINTEIIIGDLNSGKTDVISNTTLFNWQMGARLQWVPGTKNTIAFNALEDGVHSSKFIDLDKCHEQTLPYPIYAFSHSGSYFVTCDFNRIELHMTGYGYWQKNTKKALTSDFAFVNMHGEIMNYFSVSSNDPDFFVTHFQFNPADTKLAYFIRVPTNKNAFKTIMEVRNLASDEVVRVVDFDYISHYCWVGDEDILLYGKVARSKGYFRYDLTSGDVTLFISLQELPDGHPTRAGDIIITDTYPDRDRICSLYLSRHSTRILLKEAWHPIKFSDYSRVDFHPKLSASGRLVSIDTIFKSAHSVEVINIDQVLSDKDIVNKFEA